MTNEDSITLSKVYTHLIASAASSIHAIHGKNLGVETLIAAIDCPAS